MNLTIKNLLLTVIAAMSLGFASVGIADEMPEPVAMSELTVNINTASAETLADRLDGVGLSRAEAIVQYREAHGKFYSAEELTAVRGIGETTVAKNVSKITVD